MLSFFSASFPSALSVSCTSPEPGEREDLPSSTYTRSSCEEKNNKPPEGEGDGGGPEPEKDNSETPRARAAATRRLLPDDPQCDALLRADGFYEDVNVATTRIQPAEHLHITDHTGTQTPDIFALYKARLQENSDRVTRRASGDSRRGSQASTVTASSTTTSTAEVLAPSTSSCSSFSSSSSSRGSGLLSTSASFCSVLSAAGPQNILHTESLHMSETEDSASSVAEEGFYSGGLTRGGNALNTNELPEPVAPFNGLLQNQKQGVTAPSDPVSSPARPSGPTFSPKNRFLKTDSSVDKTIALAPKLTEQQQQAKASPKATRRALLSSDQQDGMHGSSLWEASSADEDTQGLAGANGNATMPKRAPKRTVLNLNRSDEVPPGEDFVSNANDRENDYKGGTRPGGASKKTLQPSEAERRRLLEADSQLRDEEQLERRSENIASSSSTSAASSPQTRPTSSSLPTTGGLKINKKFYDWEPDMPEPKYEKFSGSNHVWIHVYEIDGFTQWLNESFLKSNDWGAYHAGVEVYGDEWSFLFYNDVLDKTVTGCNRVAPRRHPDFSYRDSVYMGRTTLSANEVSKLLLRMMDAWPTVSYHITEKNCVDFAYAFCGELRVPRPFPQWVRGGLHLARNNGGVKNVVDGIWGVVKWWNQVEEDQAYVPPPHATAQSYIEDTTGISREDALADAVDIKLIERGAVNGGLPMTYSRPSGSSRSPTSRSREERGGTDTKGGSRGWTAAEGSAARASGSASRSPIRSSSSIPRLAEQGPPPAPPDDALEVYRRASGSSNSPAATRPSREVAQPRRQPPPDPLRGTAISTESIHDEEMDVTIVKSE